MIPVERFLSVGYYSLHYVNDYDSSNNRKNHLKYLEVIVNGLMILLKTCENGYFKKSMWNHKLNVMSSVY